MTSNGGSTHVKPAHARQNTRSKVAVISLTSQGSEGGVPWSVMSLLYLPRLFAENERISQLAGSSERNSPSYGIQTATGSSILRTWDWKTTLSLQVFGCEFCKRMLRTFRMG